MHRNAKLRTVTSSPVAAYPGMVGPTRGGPTSADCDVGRIDCRGWVVANAVRTLDSARGGAPVLRSESVQFLRKSRLVPAVALVLLAWTAVDLTNASLCALDQEGAARSACVVVMQQIGRGQQDGGSVPTHVDDCFCCSHCVDAAALPALTITCFTADSMGFERVSPPRSIPRSLDHPPQLAS